MKKKKKNTPLLDNLQIWVSPITSRRPGYVVLTQTKKGMYVNEYEWNDVRFSFTSSCLWSEHVLFTLFVFVCATHIVLCCVFFFVCLRLVYPVLPVSLSCQFFIVPSVFSNVFHRLFNFTCTRNLKEQCFIVVLFFTDVCNFVNLTHDCCY
jgi:hypothetical protein